jgi:hypothetical protein
MKIKNTTNPLIAELYVTLGQTISLAGEYMSVLSNEDFNENDKNSIVKNLIEERDSLLSRLDKDIQSLTEEIKINGKNQRRSTDLPYSTANMVLFHSIEALKDLRTLFNFVNKDSRSATHCMTRTKLKVESLLLLIGKK